MKMKMEVYMVGLDEMTEEMQEEVVHLENVLVENERIVNEQWKITWNTVKEVWDLKRRDEVRLGVEI